jgi:hypothetical protein
MANLNPELDDFDVTFWRVVEDRTKEDGRRVLGIPLSPKYATLEEVRAALSPARAANPLAYVQRATIFFCPDDPADVAERESLLAELHSIAA